MSKAIPNKERIAKALQIACSYIGTDGGHHKQRALVDIIKVLLGCPTIKKSAKDYNGVAYEYEALGENAAYKKFVKDYCVGEDGRDTYEWDEGIA